MKCILILAAQFQVWDGLVTQVLVDNNIAREANPFVKSFVEQGNFLIFKILGALLCIAVLWVLYKYAPRFSFAVASCIAVFYAVILAWNFFVVFNVV
jgi:hypothetical protein